MRTLLSRRRAGGLAIVMAPRLPAGRADVVITNPDGETSRLTGGFEALSRPPPLISGLDSSRGVTAGGTAVSILGDGFQPGATATFDGLAAKVYFTGEHELYVTVPRHDAGFVDVVVTNADGGTGTLRSGFAYVRPTLTDFNGDWQGFIALEGPPISFSVQNDRLVSISCGGVTQTLTLPPSTSLGDFAAIENGRVLITGAIAGKDYAEGVISTDACPTVDFWAQRGTATAAARRTRR